MLHIRLNNAVRDRGATTWNNPRLKLEA